MNDPGQISAYPSDLIDSYRILFPEKVNNNVRVTAGLDIESLKSAFRSRALETHPDRAAQLGINPENLQERFIEIEHAYNRVLEYLKHRAEQQLRPCEPRKAKKTETAEKSEEESPSGSGLPAIVFLTGQYLLYTGRIQLNDLLDAIRWQREMRPLFGNIAVEMYHMSERDINCVLSSRGYSERFGECALRLGLINSFQFRTILERQRGMQKPIGEYFVKNGIMTRNELHAILREHQIHNRRAASLRKESS